MKNDMNIESYEGKDAFYTGTDEEYAEFLKNSNIEFDENEQTEPVENTQKINLNDTINIQSVIEKFKKTAGGIKDTVVSKMDGFKAKKESNAAKAEEKPSEEEETADSGRNENILERETAAVKDRIKTTVKNASDKIENFKSGMSSVSEISDRFDGVDRDIQNISSEIESIAKSVDELSQKMTAMEVKDTQRMGDHERNYSDIKRSVNEMGANVSDIKQALNSVSKLNDSVFDLKNSQMNTKKILSDLGTSFTRLKKKCVLGVTVLSILSAIIIVLEIVLMLS
jgi:chromosome segregation ATPase